MSSAAPTTTVEPAPSSILGKVMRGTFWLGLKMPVQVIIALYSIPLTQRYIGEADNGAYVFAWGYGYIQFLLDFGMGSSLQRQMVDAYARRDRDAVNRTIACGMNFYAGVALIQLGFLLWLVHGGLPEHFRGNPMVIGVLWVQILATPFFGLSTVASGVLQAAGRYDFIPRLEMAIVLLRFACLMVGYWTNASFLIVVAVQVTIQIGLSLGPALWVMVKDLGFVPHFGGARRSDYAAMLHISIYMSLMQWSVVLADKVDTTVLGYGLQVAEPGPLITIYQNVSKPFLQIRQTGWTLAYLVMPAAVSLIASGDRAGLERIKFDGSRALIGLLTPPTLLAGLYASPFLSLWVGTKFAPDAWMLQLFLVAILPMALLVLCQIALGMGKIEVLAWSSLGGALVNLPLSYVLTRKLGVSGVIWGTVLTTLISNMLIPGLYLFRLLEIRPGAFFVRTLKSPLCGGLALVVACLAFRMVVPAEPPETGSTAARSLPFLANLAVGSLAYVAGYAIPIAGRGDLAAILRKLRPRAAHGDAA